MFGWRAGLRGGGDAPQLERLILAGKWNAHFSELSGGHRQRLFIALTLVNEPQIMFPDEMTTGPDSVARLVA